jgi:hypothetical protein
MVELDPVKVQTTPKEGVDREARTLEEEGNGAYPLIGL